MDIELIQTAQKALKLESILMKDFKLESNIELHEESVEESVYLVKTMKKLVSFEEYELEDDTKQVKYLFKFGVILLPKGFKGDEITDPDVISLVEAVYSSSYTYDKDVSEESLKEFGKYNVPYQLWTYWREFVQSSLSRVGITSFTMPMMLHHSSKEED